MKKTITKPDGTTEVVEGTAEEIAAYERQIKQQNQDESKKPTSQPGLLNEENQGLQLSPNVVTYWYPVHAFNCELMVARHGWMSVLPPQCTCGATPRRPVDFAPLIDWTVYGWRTEDTTNSNPWALPKVTFKG